MEQTTSFVTQLIALFFDASGTPHGWVWGVSVIMLATYALGVHWLRGRFQIVEELTEMTDPKPGWKQRSDSIHAIFLVRGLLPDDKAWTQFKKDHKKFVGEFNKENKRDITIKYPD